MRVFEALPVLRSGLSQEAEVLDDSRSDRFQELCRRWSDVDKEVPGAIVLPSCEADCQIAVNFTCATKQAEGLTQSFVR
jgi:hypothetical protein